MSDNPLHISKSMRYIAIEGWLLAPSFNMGVANLNLWDIGWQDFFSCLIQIVLAFPHVGIAWCKMLSATGGSATPGVSLTWCVVWTLSSEEFTLLNGLEELCVSFVGRVIGTVNYMIYTGIGEIFHGLSCWVLSPCFNSLRHLVVWCLTSMHHLIVRGHRRFSIVIESTTTSVELLLIRILLRWEWASP